MATYSKPVKVPRWNDNLTNNLEPPEAKKDVGWVFEEVHPSTFENWKANLNGQWWKWVDERLEDGITNDVLRTKMPLSIDGSNNFVLEDAAGDPKINFRGLGGDSYMLFDESAGQWELWIGGAKQIHANTSTVFINADLEIGDDLVLPGGLVVGFSGTAVDDAIQLGDLNYRFYFDGTDPRIIFDDAGGTPDQLVYDRSANKLQVSSAITTEFLRPATAAVGDFAVFGTVDAGLGQVAIGWDLDDQPAIFWDVADNDVWAFDQTSDVWRWKLGGVTEYEFSASTFNTNGNSINVGSGGITNAGAISGATTIGMGGALSGATNIDGSGDLTMGSITMTGTISTTGVGNFDTRVETPEILFDTDDRILFSSNTWDWQLAGGSIAKLFLSASSGTNPSGPCTRLYLGNDSPYTSSNSRDLPFLEVESDNVVSWQRLARFTDGNQGLDIVANTLTGQPGVGGYICNPGGGAGTSGWTIGGQTSGLAAGEIHFAEGARIQFQMRMAEATDVTPGYFAPDDVGATDVFTGYDLGTYTKAFRRVVQTELVVRGPDETLECKEGTADTMFFAHDNGNTWMAFETTDYSPNYTVEVSHLYPLFRNDNIRHLGAATGYWLQCYVNNLRYKSSATFDTYDDLALIEACEPDHTAAAMTKDKGGAEHAVQPVRKSTIPWPMLADCDREGDYFIDGGDSIMFLLGAIKQLYKKHKNEVAALGARLEALEARA